MGPAVPPYVHGHGLLDGKVVVVTAQVEFMIVQVYVMVMQ